MYDLIRPYRRIPYILIICDSCRRVNSFLAASADFGLHCPSLCHIRQNGGCSTLGRQLTAYPSVGIMVHLLHHPVGSPAGELCRYPFPGAQKDGCVYSGFRCCPRPPRCMVVHSGCSYNFKRGASGAFQPLPVQNPQPLSNRYRLENIRKAFAISPFQSVRHSGDTSTHLIDQFLPCYCI